MCVIETRTYVASDKAYERLRPCPRSVGNRACPATTHKEVFIHESDPFPSPGSFRRDGDSHSSSPLSSQPSTPTIPAYEYREPSGVERRSSKKGSLYIVPELHFRSGNKRNSNQKKSNRLSTESAYSNTSDRVAIAPDSPLRSPFNSPLRSSPAMPEAPVPPAAADFPLFGTDTGHSGYTPPATPYRPSHTAAAPSYTAPASPLYNTTTATPARGTVAYAYPPPLVAQSPLTSSPPLATQTGGSNGGNGPPRPPVITTAAAASPDDPPDSPNTHRRRRQRPRVLVTQQRNPPPAPEPESAHDEDADVRNRATGREELRRRSRQLAGEPASPHDENDVRFRADGREELRRQKQQRDAAEAEAEQRRRAQQNAEEEDARKERERLTARDRLRNEDGWTRREQERLDDRERQREEDRRRRERAERAEREAAERAERLEREAEAAQREKERQRQEREARRRQREYEDLLRQVDLEREEADRLAAAEAAAEEAAQRTRVRFDSPRRERYERERRLREEEDAVRRRRREKLAADIRQAEADVAYWTARARAYEPAPASPSWRRGSTLEPSSPTSPLRERRGGGRNVVVHSPTEDRDAFRDRGLEHIARQRVSRGSGDHSYYEGSRRYPN